ncbi:RNA-binding S4 domain-containing protein [Gilvimarinus polysaccharolyticus]|uniref:RNA-binding S4 domain-containing protein n=1 Tax=Gilvimarinus polysaccharolyticus TaxID=863921 RepID=UPI000673AEAC|nr:S4 domain-containing protein [Gilvimarinus polysaccharolyticus]
MGESANSKVRVDKWLWAARFFKTRSLAKAAIEAGKVNTDGQRLKPSRELEIGMLLTIRQGWDEKTVQVLALSGQRRGAPEAQLLYQETEASIALREQRAIERKAGLGSFIISEHRPNKKERRQIHRFKRIMDEPN